MGQQAKPKVVQWHSGQSRYTAVRFSRLKFGRGRESERDIELVEGRRTGV